MPDCCGAIVGIPVNETLIYQAKQYAPGGTYTNSITGVALSSNDNDPLIQLIGQPLQIPVPQLLIAYNTDLCYGGPNLPNDPAICPNIPGNKYTVSRVYSVSNNVTTSAVNYYFLLNDLIFEIFCLYFRPWWWGFGQLLQAAAIPCSVAMQKLES